MLRELFDSLDGAWLDVTITSMCGFWCRIHWALLGEDKFGFLKRLSASRQSLQALWVAALYSYLSKSYSSCWVKSLLPGNYGMLRGWNSETNYGQGLFLLIGFMAYIADVLLPSTTSN